LKLKIKRLHQQAIMPVYSTDGAACFDLHACTVDGYTQTGSLVTEGTPVLVGTGLAFEVPQGHALMIYSRSGHGFIHNVRLANCVGVIDSDYRGEVAVKLTCDWDDEKSMPIKIMPGMRIAQAMIVPVPKVEFVEVEELGQTERGAGGFGSTGN
jgi:dUTP pyrophosphatase